MIVISAKEAVTAFFVLLALLITVVAIGCAIAVVNNIIKSVHNWLDDHKKEKVYTSKLSVREFVE